MAKNFDKFYTKTEQAKKCVDFVNITLNNKVTKYFEPSAGNGSFLPFLNNFIAIDIKPEHESIIQMNFLDFNEVKSEYFCIGNPPFGKRSVTALDFLNHSSKLFEGVGFILPVSFMKWSVQKEINKDFKLIGFEYLPANSFTDNGKDYEIRTVFQIWIKKGGIFDFEQKDLRMKKAPSTSHPDFNIWQHNATEGSRKYVEEAWEIATWRQGYKDFNEIFTREKDYDLLKDRVYNTNQQFFFIQPLNEISREIINKIDFDALAERNTSVKGFGKGDFVSLYTEMKENYEKGVLK